MHNHQLQLWAAAKIAKNQLEIAKTAKWCYLLSLIAGRFVIRGSCGQLSRMQGRANRGGVEWWLDYSGILDKGHNAATKEERMGCSSDKTKSSSRARTVIYRGTIRGTLYIVRIW